MGFFIAISLFLKNDLFSWKMTYDEQFPRYSHFYDFNTRDWSGEMIFSR